MINLPRQIAVVVQKQDAVQLEHPAAKANSYISVTANVPRQRTGGAGPAALAPIGDAVLNAKARKKIPLGGMILAHVVCSHENRRGGDAGRTGV